MILRNALPFIFCICGLGLACNFNSTLCFYAGILLLLVACLIWERRLENQQG